MNEDKIILSPGDVCTLLKTKESTLRKYALILQDAGYHFDTNEKGQRAYYNKDVIAFKKLVEINKSTDMTLEQSANAVISWFEQSNMSLRVTENKREIERYSDDIKELKETVQKQTILIQELVKQMDQQNKYIVERFERMERDRELTESLRTALTETQKQIASAQEEKKGFWSKLFGK